MSSLFVPAGSGPKYAAGEALVTIAKVTGDQTAQRVAVAEHILYPKKLAAPIHTHSREDEVSYVLEGRIGAQIGEEIFEAGPGDLVLKPKEVPHTFWNSGDEPARLVEIIAPAGFERYFEELEPLIPTDGSMPDLAQLIELSGRYGVAIDMNSIPELMQAHGVGV